MWATLQVITTHAMKHTKISNPNGQVIEVQYEILKAIAYWMTIQYDSMGRVTVCDIRIGVDTNITRYSYEYDADGQLQAVRRLIITLIFSLVLY